MPHAHLLLPNRDQTPRQIVVVLPHQAVGDHDVVDVAQDEGVLRSVGVFGAEEGRGVRTPVAVWV